MKKLLLGSTALVAGGLLAAPAMAADPIKIGVGGYYQFYAIAGGIESEEADIERGVRRCILTRRHQQIAAGNLDRQLHARAFRGGPDDACAGRKSQAVGQR